MTMQVWDPIRASGWFEEGLEEVVRGLRTAPQACNCVPTDVAEDADQLLLKVELPGVAANEVSIKVEDDVLTISGERKHEENGKTYLRVERSYGKFSRDFTMPNYVDSGKITAEFKDGVLTLHLPKKAETKPRQIQVTVTTN